MFKGWINHTIHNNNLDYVKMYTQKPGQKFFNREVKFTLPPLSQCTIFEDHEIDYKWESRILNVKS